MRPMAGSRGRTRRSSAAWPWLALVAGAGLAACGSDEDGAAESELCTPGQTESCSGPEGCSGIRTCDGDGSAWGACECGALGSGGASGGGANTESGGAPAVGGTGGSPVTGNSGGSAGMSAGTGGAGTGGVAAGGTGTGGTGTGGALAAGGTGGNGSGGDGTGGDATGGSGTGGALETGGAPSSGGTGVGGTVESSGGAAGDGGSAGSVGGSSVGLGGAATVGGGAGASAGGTTGTVTSLNDYVRVIGPMTVQGPDQASGVTHQPETDTFYVVTNTSHLLHEFSADFSTRLRTISLDNGPTDTEGVAYLGNDRFAIVVEDNEVYVVTIEPGAVTADMGAADVERYVPSAPPATMNVGFEGVTWQPGVGVAGRFYVCQEGGGNVPIRVLSFLRSDAAGTYDYSNGSLAVDEPWDAATEVGAVMGDLAGVAFDVESNTLLVLSQESSRVIRAVPETGEILEQRDLEGSPQYEGITFATGGRLVLVSEPNWVEVYQLD